MNFFYKIYESFVHFVFYYFLKPGNYEFCCMEVEDDEKHEYLKDMFSLVDDHGEFFSTLPVPKNGIFCVAIMTPIHGEGSKAANMTGGGTAYDNYCY